MTAKVWFSATELAALKLPGLPVTQKGILDVAHREDWFHAVHSEVGALYRQRQGRAGGGFEFHILVVSVLAHRRAEALLEMNQAARAIFAGGAQ